MTPNILQHLTDTTTQRKAVWHAHFAKHPWRPVVNVTDHT